MVRHVHIFCTAAHLDAAPADVWVCAALLAGVGAPPLPDSFAGADEDIRIVMPGYRGARRAA